MMWVLLRAPKGNLGVCVPRVAGLFNRCGGLQCMFCNLRRHQRQRSQCVGTADDPFVRHFCSNRVAAKAIQGRGNTFLYPAQSRIGEQVFTLVRHPVLELPVLKGVNVEADNHGDTRARGCEPQCIATSVCR